MDAEQGTGALLKRMTNNATLKRFALPNLAVDSPAEESSVQFPQNPLELTIKIALEKLGMCHVLRWQSGEDDHEKCEGPFDCGCQYALSDHLECLFSPCVTIMNTLVGTKRLCNAIPSSLT
jgi:hypothetical protein